MASVEEFIMANHESIQAGQGSIRICCPLCSHHSKKLYISFTKGVFHCFHCEAKGSLRSFIYMFHNSERKGLDLDYAKTAVKKLDKFATPLPEGYRELSTQKSIMALQYMNYVFGRGFTIKTLKDVRMGYSPELSYHLIFPVYTENYQQVYYTTRSIQKDAPMKTINPSGSDSRYGKADVLFNIQNARHNSSVYVVEGIFDCLSLMTLSYNAVASLGKTLSDNQIGILLNNKFHQIIICYDGNAIDDTYKTAEKLSKYHNNVWICELPKGEHDDPNELLKINTLQFHLQKIKKYSKILHIRERIEAIKKFNSF